MNLFWKQPQKLFTNLCPSYTIREHVSSAMPGGSIREG